MILYLFQHQNKLILLLKVQFTPREGSSIVFSLCQCTLQVICLLAVSVYDKYFRLTCILPAKVPALPVV